MANTALSHQAADAHGHEKAHPLRIDREGFALLRDRLREANAGNPQFELQHQRLVALLQTALRRLESGFGDQIELVVADGDWARYGIDLRNLPFDDVVLLNRRARARAAILTLLGYCRSRVRGSS
jgi:hypothetical protein